MRRGLTPSRNHFLGFLATYLKSKSDFYFPYFYRNFHFVLLSSNLSIDYILIISHSEHYVNSFSENLYFYLLFTSYLFKKNDFFY